MKSNRKIATYRASAQEKDFSDSYDFDNFFQTTRPMASHGLQTQSHGARNCSPLKKRAKRLRADMQETTSLVDSDRATGSGLKPHSGLPATQEACHAQP